MGEGVAGYGIRFVSKEEGPTILSLVPNGEASRSGVITEGDVLVAVDGISIAGIPFSEVCTNLSECSVTASSSILSSLIQLLNW